MTKYYTIDNVQIKTKKVKDDHYYYTLTMIIVDPINYSHISFSYKNDLWEVCTTHSAGALTENPIFDFKDF